MTPQAVTNGGGERKEGTAMNSRAKTAGRRFAVVLGLAVLALTVAGDRSRAASVPATIYGQDPLEVLELKVRPNVIVVLDTSGSMKWSLQASANPTDNFYPPQAGDHPRSKVWQAKQVLKKIVEGNQDKVSFMFTQYAQGDTTAQIVMRNRAATKAADSGENRFIYSTYSCAAPGCPAAVNAAMTNGDSNDGLLESPTMATTQLAVRNDFGGTGDRGVQSWQIIHAGWNTLHFRENNGAVVCSATLGGPFPKFYARGGSGATPATSTTPQNLAFDLQTAMNSASCSGTKANTYAVGYNAGAGTFTFTATGPNNFQLNPTGSPSNINAALGGLPTTVASPGIAGGTATITLTSSSSPARLTAMRRNNSNTRITTNAAHGVVSGASCAVNGMSPGSLNGTYTVSSVTTTSPYYIYFAVTGSATATVLGTVTCTQTVAPVTGTILTSGTPYSLLYRPVAAASNNPAYGDDLPNPVYDWLGISYMNVETVASTATTVFSARAQRFWNGETIRVTSDGQTCGMTFPTAAERTNPPTFKLQLVAANCGADVTGAVATFRWGGAYYVPEGNGSYCGGLAPTRVPLIPCDLRAPAPAQFTTIAPWLNNEFPLDATGMPEAAPKNLLTGAAATGYTEAQDGSWNTLSHPPFMAGGMKGFGSTPIAASLDDIKTLFGTSGTTGLWGAGQTGATGMAGPPPYRLDPIKNHKNPKEKTIVLFVTDGEDTCAGQGNNDLNALAAARSAELLYQRIVSTEPASSVQTYVIGFGGAFGGNDEAPRLNWIAWGGSGLGDTATGQPDVNVSGSRWDPSYSGSYYDDCSRAGSQCQSINNALKPLRNACSTCQDAFLAPDADTLKRQLQSIIDQGASDGDFNAQQSITETVFEYVDLASGNGKTYDARSPKTRYQAIVPTRFVSSFSLPGFKGQLRAYQNDGAGNSVLKWSAGDKLRQQVATEMGTCSTGTQGGGVGQCTFLQLHGGASDSTISSSAAKIKRRVYTTSRNGVYTYDPASLMAGTANSRVTLWPPATSVAPSDYTSVGTLDQALGLPTNVGACTLVSPYTDCPSQWLAQLQGDFGACLGSNIGASHPCASASASTKALAARREARDMILAFMAGAKPIPVVGGGVKRSSAAIGTAPTGSLLFSVRDWLLADSELATAAVVTQPSLDQPSATPYVAEYQLMTNGPRNDSQKNPDTGGAQLRQGFGLTQPDDDQTVGPGQNDTRAALKPAMTVVYQPANDMLHAFRAGPNCSPSTASCQETGGEELWGFVPFDQLGALRLRFINEPQGRDNHVFMLARGVRFADVFVPGAMTNVNIGGVTVPSMKGVWRRIMYFGRGIGGKHVTALDVTSPGPYTARALETVGPIPLWNRGNPDTQDGVAGSSALNGSALDRDAYAKMGETWSMPTVAYVNTDKTNPLYVTSRRPDGIDFALFMGSGYGDTGEGTTHYALDALSGDVIAAVDVEATAASYGLTRSGLSYGNALVANSVSYNRVISQALKNTHPWAYSSARVYVGDLHGRLWKFLTARPDVAIPVADLGADQPVGTAVALIDSDPTETATAGPYIFVTSGAEKRASGPFRNFSFKDEGTDTQVTTGGAVTDDGVTTYAPAVKQFARTFDQGDPQANCGYTEEALFRGTVQPAGAFECSQPITGGKCDGTTLWRVFFAGTRLSLPNTKYAPPTPLACGTGQYPCRSQFDTIIYALGAQTGGAAYDLNSSGDDAYRVFRDSRIAAIGMAADPDPNRAGSSFMADEGLMKGTPKPPPPPGVPPTAQTATANVVFVREPGQPAPAVRYGSTVCQ
jgi:hypothetical protein